MSLFIMGDIHFKSKNFQEGDELIEKSVLCAKKYEPSAIIMLGDILDTHEVVRNTPWKQACRYIELMSEIAPTFILMGNHDLINQNQFLTDNHFFNPLKKWKNVTIVDKPIVELISDIKIVLCPYVPPGRFIEALDTLYSEGKEWKDANYIFAHQEFKGCSYGNRTSENGDIWSIKYPKVISGHIHTPQSLGNILYPGSSRQVSSDELPDKRVWLLKDKKILKIDLKLKSRKEIELNYEDVSNFDFSLTKRYYVKIKLIGSPEQFKIFRKSQLHAKLIRNKVSIGFLPIPEDENNNMDKNEITFLGILQQLVKSKKDHYLDEAYKSVVTKL